MTDLCLRPRPRIHRHAPTCTCYTCGSLGPHHARCEIRRVLELCDESDQNRPRIDGYLINRTVPVKDIRRALDGAE